ncbi:hypothetical protein Tco_0926798 [Tanacetum coccineum]|uniref:Uncharacterized protein n=1 Tax=Tanacetum coccineum TaxID=301880 RepID=A0ABQ5DBN4_9ASTR
MDMENLFDSQDLYAGQGSGQGSGLHFVHSNQDYYPSQDYSMGHGSTPVKDDSPVEEVALVKAKNAIKRASKAKKNDNKETAKPWITEDEVALCRAWCDVSENSIRGNAMKNRGFRGNSINTISAVRMYSLLFLLNVSLSNITSCARDHPSTLYLKATIVIHFCRLLVSIFVLRTLGS